MELPNLRVDEEKLVKILQQYFVLRLFLFGSVLTDHFSDQSDIDVLVEFQSAKPIDLFDMMNLKNELQELFGRKVDLVEKAGLVNPYRREEILRTSMKVYGK